MDSFREWGSSEFEQHSQRLRREARRVLRNEHDAEDAEQATWLAALEQRHREVRDLKAWSTTVVRRQAGRIRTRETRIRDRLESFFVERQAVELPADDGIEIDVERIVDRLPVHFRDVVRLHYFEGLTLPVVAERLGRSLNTVKSQLRRAQALMANQLRNESCRPRGRTAGIGVLWFARVRQKALRWLAWCAGLILVPILLLKILSPSSTEVPTAMGSTAPSELPETVASSAPRSSHGLPAARGAGGLRVRAVFADDGRPASGISVWLESSAGSVFAPPETTDERGELRIGQVDPGGYEVVPSAGPRVPAEVVASAESVVTISIQPLRPLTGTVRCRSTREGIAGATVLVSAPNRIDLWRRAGVSGAGGRFVLDGIAPDCWVASVVPGRPPSVWRRLSATTGGDRAEMTLFQPPSRDPIEGRVVSDEGEPCVGAKVVNFVPDQTPRRKRGGWTLGFPPVAAVAGSDGEFSIERHARLENILVVTAPGFAPRVVRVASSAEGPVDVRLDRGQEIRGRVCDAHGRGVADVPISVERKWPLDASMVKSDADGRFKVRVMAAEKLALRASGGVESVVWAGSPPAGGDLGDLVLGSAATIRGVVEGVAGESVAGWVVRVYKAPGDGLDLSFLYRGDARSVTVGPSGEFAIPGCDPAEHVVCLHDPDLSLDRPVLACGGVWPGKPTPVILQRPKQVASLSGALAPGQFDSHVWLRSREWVHRTAVGQDGRFSVRPVPPGDVEILVESDESRPIPCSSVVLHPGQDLNIGVVRGASPGSAVFRWTVPEGVANENPRVVMVGVGFRKEKGPGGLETAVEFLDLAPGTYAVRLVLGSVPVAFATVTVESGAGTQHLFEVQRTRPVVLRLAVHDVSFPIRPTIEMVRREDGMSILYEQVPPAKSTAPLDVQLGVPEGTWDVLVSAPGNWEGRSVMHVQCDDDAPVMVELAVRRR